MPAYAIWALIWGMLVSPESIWAPTAQRLIVNVRDMGARGDGLTDDYEALQRAVHRINEHHGGTLFFPPGRYRIDRFVVTGPNSNGVQDLVFQGCDGLAVVGDRAKIDLKGDFQRGADWAGAGGHHYSYRRCVQPLVFGACRDFRVEGLEIDGHVELTTRAPNLSETPGSGIYTYECSDYLIRNVYVHHLPTDGIYLGGSPRHADRNAVLENVRSTHNARQGLSIIQLRGGSFISCRFEKTGQTDGSYGGHWPMAGVDVEPEHDVPEVDVRTGDLNFANCIFQDNNGDQFVSLGGRMVEDVRLIGCTVDQGQSPYPYQLRLAVNGGLLNDCRLMLERMDVSWPGLASRTTVRNCQIISAGCALWSEQESEVLVEHNTLIGLQRRPATTPMPFLRNSCAIFRHNRLYLPPAAYSRIPSHPMALIGQAGKRLGNTFLHAPGTLPFVVRYHPAGQPENEAFVEQAGPAMNP